MFTKRIKRPTRRFAAVVGCYLLILSSKVHGGSAQQLTLQAYDNGAFVGTPIQEVALDYDSSVSIPGIVAVRIMGSILVDCSAEPTAGNVHVTCAHENKFKNDNEELPGFFWLDDHLVCQSGFYNITSMMQMDGSIRTPIVVSTRRTEWVVYGEYWPQGESFSLMNSVGDIKLVSGSTHTSRSILSQVKPAIPALELRRIELMQKLQNGWGLYSHNSLQEAILLPEGTRLRWEFCTSPNDPSSCDPTPKIPATVRPQFAFKTASRNSVEVMRYDVAYPAENVTLRVTYRFDQDDDSLELTFHSTSTPTSGYLRFTADVAYFPARRGKSFQPSPASLAVSATGLRSFTFCTCGVDGRSEILVEDTGEPNAVMVSVPPVGHSVKIRGFDSTDTNKYDFCKASQETNSKRKKNPILPSDSHIAAIAKGLDAGIYFNLIYTPVERTLIAPVSRGWGKALCMPARLPELEYVLFDWDNVLVSYIMGVRGAKDLSYASLIQVVRSRTAKGFIPNFSAGGAKSQDRTEPPLGARVLLELVERFGDVWIVDYLWDDLAIQMDWFWSERRFDDYIVLGSDPVWYPNSHSTHSMQGARFESGLDNSPMYDGDFFKGDLMQLYDVGMTSLVLQECESLIKLASLIGRNTDDLAHRATILRRSLQKLWDPEDGIFTNMFLNGTFYKRRSPTSFYPLLSNMVATDEQVESMVEHWLTNGTRFCIGERSVDCWWGLPSISADDPAFPKLGYWRGYVWGPMSILVYWGLDNYSHLPSVSLAKHQLASQMSDMFLNLWEKKGRVCENYSPHLNATDCTGDKFYHWGALAGLLALLEVNQTEESSRIQ